MKGILEFDLPDEQPEFLLAAGASKYLSALEDLANEFRSKAKHGEPATTWEDVKELFWSTLGEAGVELP